MEELHWIIYPSSDGLYSGFHINLKKVILNDTFRNPFKRTDVLRVASYKEVQQALVLLNLGLSKIEIEEVLNDSN